MKDGKRRFVESSSLDERDSNDRTYIGLLVVADSPDFDRFGDGLTSLLEWHHLVAFLSQLTNHVSVMIQLIPQLLHPLKQPLSLVQTELGLAVHGVQHFVTSVKKKDVITSPPISIKSK